MIRTALSASEMCRPSEGLKHGLAEGRIIKQSGLGDAYEKEILPLVFRYFFFNSYEATIDCLEPRGCPIVVRISYHPAFVVKGKSSSRLIQTYSVSPSYLAFTVPFGIDDYTVTFQRPYWQKLLATLCFAFICLVGLSMMFLGSETKPKEIEKEKPKAKSE